MPQYHILSRILDGKEFRSEGIIRARSVRAAFPAYKKYCADNGIEIDQKRNYHFYAINHARIFHFKKGKREMTSFYGNHKTKETREKEKRWRKLERENNKFHKLIMGTK